jgi:hypothetical protein
MKNEKALFEKCALILGRELEVVKKIAALQAVIWKAVSNREWTDFEAHNQAINALGGEFDGLETEREGLLAKMGGDTGQEDEKRRFYRLVSRFSPNFRRDLTGIYRTLKLETMKVRMSNEALLSYLAEARTTMAGFLEAVFPERAGRLYTPRGTQAAADMRSVVLNRHF